MEKLKGRDLNGSINKCYSLYYKNNDESSGGGDVCDTGKVKMKSPRKRNGNEVFRNINVDEEHKECVKDDNIKQEITTEKVNFSSALLKCSDTNSIENTSEDNNNYKDAINSVCGLRKRRLSDSESDLQSSTLYDDELNKRVKFEGVKEIMFQVS